ncbi:MAG: 4Fe-4S dicluster domain-containing protein [Candidatus Krumholzibacteriia bacterium]
MSVDRRDFLRLAGLAGAAAAVTGKAAGAVAQTLPVVAEYERPLEGRRWAMVVDLRKWTEEDSRLTREACHRVHNVPEFESPKDEIRWIWTEKFEHAFHEVEDHHHLAERIKHMDVPLLCNHCDNPPCTRVCPTQATWKREKDGVVMMDWHRCIGCRYCIAACPYGSRSFNWRDPRPHIANIGHEFPTRQRGVVEKCTLCEERLSRGQIPACVEACRSGAMVFGDLEDPDSQVRKLLAENYTIRRKPNLGTQPEVYYIV